MTSDAEFAAIFPRVRLSLQQLYHSAIDSACAEFSIETTRARTAAFLAQIGHETAGLLWLEELGDATYFARYDGRADLGNVHPGDGARYHGRGMIQLTGRANYARVGEALALPLELEPELAVEPANAARIAGFFWQSHGCNELADADAFTQITKTINGGLNGQADRASRWAHCKAVLGIAERIH